MVARARDSVACAHATSERPQAGILRPLTTGQPPDRATIARAKSMPVPALLIGWMASERARNLSSRRGQS